LLQDVKEDSEVTVVQLREKVVLVEEANQETHLLLELADSQTDLRDAKAVHPKDQ
jgi:hypothetical protein